MFLKQVVPLDPGMFMYVVLVNMRLAGLEDETRGLAGLQKLRGENYTPSLCNQLLLVRQVGGGGLHGAVHGAGRHAAAPPQQERGEHGAAHTDRQQGGGQVGRHQ